MVAISNKAIALFALFSVMTSPALAEEAGHHSGGLPQFDPTSWPSQIFWLSVFFVALYFVFGKSIIPSLGQTIETRAQTITDNVKKAEDFSREAEILSVEVAKAMKDANQKAGAEVAEAENAAKSHLSSALAEFRTKYESQVEATEKRITEAKDKAMSDMQAIAATLAGQAAEKIAGIPSHESGAEQVVKTLSDKQKQAA